MNTKLYHLIYQFACFATLLFFIGLPATLAHAADYSANTVVNRASGECHYTVISIHTPHTGSDSKIYIFINKYEF